MGRASNRKKLQRTGGTFPFRLLLGWVKPYEGPGRMCQCYKSPAVFTCESYTDIFGHVRLVAGGMTEKQATDKTWSEALAEQITGKYIPKATTYHCQSCAHKILSSASSDEGAVLMMMPMMLVGRGSAIFGATLQTPQDDGLPFTASTMATTIEELARQLKGEGLQINLNSPDGGKHA